MSELISVVIPVYNINDYLSRCLDSVLAQTYQDIEIIAVDDGSTDGSGNLLDEYAKKYKNIRVLHKPNAGVTAARLDGVAIAQGNYIGFVDGDDEIEPDMYTHLYLNLKKTGADISHCGHQVIRPDKPVEYLYNTGRFEIQNRYEALRELLKGSFEPGLCNKLYRANLLHNLFQCGAMNQSIKINEDLLMNYWLFKMTETSVFEDFCPYHYMKREGSASRTKNLNGIWDPIQVKQIIRSDCVDTELESDSRVAYLGTCLNAYHGLIGDKQFHREKEKIYQCIRDSAVDIKYMEANRARYVRLLLKSPVLYDTIRKIYERLR